MTALIQWVRQLNLPLSKQPDTLKDLSDGVAFSHILARTDPSRFAAIDDSLSGDNWVLQLTSLKKLYKQLSQYYELVLHKSALEKLHPDLQPDLSLQIKQRDEQHTARFGILVLNATLQSSQNKNSIAAVQALQEQDQHQIMLAIEKLSKLPPPDLGDSQGNSGREQHSSINIQKSKKELQQMEQKYEDVVMQSKELQRTIEALQEELQNQKKHQSSRLEVEQTKNLLDVSEQRRNELEIELRKCHSEIEELNKRIVDLQKRADDAKKYKDEVDELQHQVETLSKASVGMERFRKRAEEAVDLKRQLQLMQESNQKLQANNTQLEAQVLRQTGAVSTQSENIYRSKDSGGDQELQVAQLTQNLQKLEQEKIKDFAHIKQLEERLQELEVVREGGSALGQQMLAGDQQYDMQGQITRLQKEKTELLQKHSSIQISDSAQLQDQLRDLMKEKDQRLQQVTQLLMDKDTLQSQQLATKDLLLRQERLNVDLKQQLTLYEAGQGSSSPETKQLQEQVATLHRALKRAKEHMTSMEKELQALRSLPPKDNYNEAIVSLQTSLKQKEDECTRLIHDMEDYKQMIRKEQRTIVSAWYDLAQRSGGVERSQTPLSWLQQQRKNNARTSSPYKGSRK